MRIRTVKAVFLGVQVPNRFAWKEGEKELTLGLAGFLAQVADLREGDAVVLEYEMVDVTPSPSDILRSIKKE